MLIYHYPGLEPIERRKNHWELNIPLSRMQNLYPHLNTWPRKIFSIKEYLERREETASKAGVTAFLHLWYFEDNKPFWDETANFICNQYDQKIPISLVWCWKKPHHHPLKKCLPHNIPLRCDDRETIKSLRNLHDGIAYLVNNYMRSPNYLLFNERPVLFLYHIEGWCSMCKSHGSVFEIIKSAFHTHNIDPYLVGISVSKVQNLHGNFILGLDAISRYNDLPDFQGHLCQDFKIQTKQYFSKWPEIINLLRRTNVAFIPSVSLGWNATLRYAGNGASSACENGYPLLPVVKSPTYHDIMWVLREAKDFMTQMRFDHIAVCAWNEWTENATLEYFLNHIKHNDRLYTY